MATSANFNPCRGVIAMSSKILPPETEFKWLFVPILKRDPKTRLHIARDAVLGVLVGVAIGAILLLLVFVGAHCLEMGSH
jgi:hypothetical protein